MPTGIFTAAGTWFHVSLDDLESYAGELIERVSVGRLLTAAETVLHAPQTLSVWMLLGALLLATPLEAAIATCILFLGWSVVGPALVLPGLVRLLGLLERAWLQGVAYVIGLSLLGVADQVTAVVIGLAGFTLLRWGLMSRLLEPLARPLRSRLYGLPVADQALRAVMIRFALRERLPLPQIDVMEHRMVRRMTRSAGKEPES